MATLFRILLNLLEVIFIGPFHLMMRYREPPKPPPLSLAEQMMRAKQMDIEDEARRKRNEAQSITGSERSLDPSEQQTGIDPAEPK